MRKKNSVSEFGAQRKELLITKFRESIARQSYISARKAFRDAAMAPAPRFWVSEERAADVISRMMRGEPVLRKMFPEKQEMYMEIYKRVKRLREKEPSAALSRLVFKVVNQEAPCSYISEGSVRHIVRNKRS